MTGDRVAEIRERVREERRAIDLGYSSPAQWVDDTEALLSELDEARGDAGNCHGAALRATAGESEARRQVKAREAENARLRAQLDTVDGVAEKYERWARTAINRRTNPIGVSIATEAAAELRAALNQGGETNGGGR